MVKKRTSLDSLFSTRTAEADNEEAVIETLVESEAVSTNTQKPKKRSLLPQANESQPKITVAPKNEIIKQTVYLPAAVHEQLRQLAFEERKKMHDYLVEGLDRVFKNRGLKPYLDLSKEKI